MPSSIKYDISDTTGTPVVPANPDATYKIIVVKSDDDAKVYQKTLNEIGGVTSEQIQDIIGAMCSGNTESNITVDYDDTSGKLNFSVPADTNTFCETASYNLTTKKATFTNNNNSTFELDLTNFADSKADSSLANVQQANTVAQITTSDSVLSAFGKVMKWFTDKISTLGTASTKDVGTSANNVIALDNNSKLPAIDGSQLTNLPSNWVLSGNNIYNSNSGNVGINTANPTGILHALGEENQTIQIKLESPSSSGASSFIHMGVDTSIAYIQAVVKPLVFYLGQERMRVTQDGNVAINTGNPSYRLHVDGSVGASSYTTSSDKKLKENIEDIPVELIDKILKINIKSFNFIDDDKKITQYGLIAQELEEIEKELKAINVDVKLVNNDDYKEEFDSENEINKFLKEKPYLEAKKSSEKYTVKEKYFVFNGKEYKTQEEAQKAEGVLKEGQLSKIEKKQRDVEKTKFTASWIQKAVNYNNFFSLKLSVVNDLISQNKAKNEFFFIDDIDKVVRDKYNKTLEVLTKDNDLIKPFKESDNTLYKRVLAWLERSPDNQITDKIYTKDELCELLRSKMDKYKLRWVGNKNKTYKEDRFVQKCHIWHQVQTQTAMGESIDSDLIKNSADSLKEILLIEQRFKQLKNQVEALEGDDVQNFNPMDDKHWDNCHIKV